jgi:hypothetical protein
MTKHCSVRLTRRHRRPAPLTSTRSQVRQKVDQLRNLYLVKNALDDLHDAFMGETMCSIEEEL